jgi:hypothetical protein
MVKKAAGMFEINIIHAGATSRQLLRVHEQPKAESSKVLRACRKLESATVLWRLLPALLTTKACSSLTN